MKKLLLGMMALGMCGTAAFADEPVFPTSLNITANSKDVTILQEIGEEYGDSQISVFGSTTRNNVTLTMEVPEGWDGYIGYVAMRGDLKAQAPADWSTIEDFVAEAGVDPEKIMKGNVFEFPADGLSTVSFLFLYVDDKVDMANPILLGVMVNHVDAPDPVFPASFNVTTEYDTVMIDQFIDEDTDIYTITATGSAPEETVDLNFNLPEDWDGIIGSVMYRGGFKQFAPAVWMPMEDFEIEHEGDGIQKGTSLQFPADGITSVGLYYLYFDGRVDTGNPIQIAVMVDKTTGVASVETEGNAVRYFNLYGVEVEEPESGIYVKVTGDKAEKIFIK